MSGMRARLSRRGARLWRPLSYLLIPLSVVPLIGVMPLVSEAHRSFQRQLTKPYDAPQVSWTAAEQARFAPLPIERDAIPVVAYRGVSDHGRDGVVSRRVFASHMALLRHAGYTTISIGDYVRWRRGEAVELPDRPILVTFDGGELETYRGADPILRQNHQRATIFIATGAIGSDDDGLLRWVELHRMLGSKRWDVQTEGDDWHGIVTTGPRGTSGPFYAVRRYTRSGGYETLAEFERRVTTDLFDAKDALEHQGISADALALPGGDYGQVAGNDSRIAPLMKGLLRRQFAVTFVAPKGPVATYTQRTGAAERFQIAPTTTIAQLYAWLRDASPSARRDAESRS